MDAKATGWDHHELEHKLAVETAFIYDEMDTDGSVSIAFKSQPVSLKGVFRIELKFSAAEIDKLYHLSQAGFTKGRLEGPKPKPETIKRRI